MKPVKPNLTLSSRLLLLVLVVFLQSCMDKAGIWKNEEIKSGKREDFRMLNEQVFKLLKANDPKQLRVFMSKELLENTYMPRLIELISNRLADDNYNMLDEYYVINRYKDYDTIKAVGADKNSYGLYYQGITREMYFSFYTPKRGDNKYVITVAFAKYDYGWKISQLDLAPYTINGKTAPELFKMAKEEYAKNYLIDAVNNMALATSCLKPCDMWQYPDEADISEFYTKIADEANERYKFPFTLTAVPTKPRIIRVYTETVSQGSFPMVYYLSSIKLTDTVALKKENAMIRKTIGTVMPGIDKDNKYIFYSAFNTGRDGRKTADHYEFTDKLQ